MRCLSKVLWGFWWAFFSAALLGAGGPPGELVPADLRPLALHAAERASWPRLRRFARSRKDPEERGLAYLTMGYQEFQAGEDGAAINDLREAALTGFSLADNAKYYWASAAREANDPLQVAQALANFSSSFPESPLRWRALELLAGALLDAGKFADAIQVLTAEPRVRQQQSLALLLAQAYSHAERWREAARAFQDVYFAFPTSSQAKIAAEALDRLRLQLGASFPSATDELQTARVQILIKASRFEEALQECEELLAARPSSPFVFHWRVERARCLLRFRRTSDALEALSQSFAADRNSDAERLALLVEANAREENVTALLQSLSQIQSLYGQSTSCAEALSTAGNYYFRQGDWQNAAHYYRVLTESFSDSDLARDASWRLAWTYYLGRDHASAWNGFWGHIRRYPDSPHVAGALFWLGRLAEERGASAEARGLYELLTKRFVHSYYALQAGQRLTNFTSGQGDGRDGEELPPNSQAALLAQSLPAPQAPPILFCTSDSENGIVRRARTLRALGLGEPAENYLKAALSEGLGSPEFRILLSQVETEHGDVSAALFDAIKVAPAYTDIAFDLLPGQLWDLLFPRSYWKLVDGQARRYRLDPYLVMGLIRQESAFNPRATSSANARGLMQILPRTVTRSRRSSGVRTVSRRLYDPAYNVRFGCAYLQGLLKQFDGKPELAMAAYHAGDSRVKEWLSKYPIRDPAEFLETIPIHTTRVYVERVLRDAAIYRQLIAGAPKFLKCN